MIYRVWGGERQEESRMNPAFLSWGSMREVVHSSKWGTKEEEQDGDGGRSHDKFRLGCAKLPRGHPVPIGYTCGSTQMYDRKSYTRVLPMREVWNLDPQDRVGTHPSTTMDEATGMVTSFRKSMQIEEMATDMTLGNTSVCSMGREREFWQKRYKRVIREIGERPGEWNVMECLGKRESQGRSIQYN